MQIEILPSLSDKNKRVRIFGKTPLDTAENMQYFWGNFIGDSWCSFGHTEVNDGDDPDKRYYIDITHNVNPFA